MSCHVGPGIVVCTTGPSALRRRLARCPVDERITEWVVEYPDSPWYDPIWQCTACGEYADQTTGMWPRPFQGGWRAAQQRTAREKYAAATYGPPPDVTEYLTLLGEPYATEPRNDLGDHRDRPDHHSRSEEVTMPAPDRYVCTDQLGVALDARPDGDVLPARYWLALADEHSGDSVAIRLRPEQARDLAAALLAWAD